MVMEGRIGIYQRLRRIVVIPSCRWIVGRQPDLYGAVVIADDRDSDEHLGALYRRTIREDRDCPHPERHSFARQALIEADEKLASHFGLSSPKGLFPKLRLVSVDKRGDLLDIQPQRKSHGHAFEPWSNMWPDKQKRSIAFEAPDADWGRAVRIALTQT